MIRVLVPLPVVLPLLAAALNVLLARSQPLQRVVSVLALIGVLATAVLLVREADGSGATVVQLGGWAAPAGISLVADRL